MGDVGVGMLGSGFIGEFHAHGLRHVEGAMVVANWGAGPERRERFAVAFGSRAVDSIEAVCSDPAVDIVVVSLPNHLHVDAVRAATEAGKAVACTKPLGRNAAEAAEMVRLVERAGVFHAYLENVVYNAEIVRMRELVEAGAIGRVVTFRAREGHSGPHAPHFWDGDLAGGGAMLDMASHGAECARFMVGKEVPVRDVFAWGATLVHGDRTAAEDNATLLIRFEDDRLATCDVSWSSKGGLEGRFETYGDGGRMVHDMGNTPLRAFVGRSGGYIAEKTDQDTGWIYPVPDETYTHGHDAMMADVVRAFRTGTEPRETFLDGFVVNAILDAGYRSMRSGRWEAPVTLASVRSVSAA